MSDKSLKNVLDAFSAPTHVGHYYEILSLPQTLMVTLNWRKTPQDARKTVDLEELYRTDPHGKYIEALKLLEKSGSYDSFEGIFSKFDFIYVRITEN